MNFPSVTLTIAILFWFAWFYVGFKFGKASVIAKEGGVKQPKGCEQGKGE